MRKYFVMIIYWEVDEEVVTIHLQFCWIYFKQKKIRTIEFSLKRFKFIDTHK